MNKLFCSVDERFENPLFEVFDGGDFVLSSYRDIEEKKPQIQIYYPDKAQTESARAALRAALELVGAADCEIKYAEIPDEDWKLSYRRHFTTERIGRHLVVHPPWEPLPTEGVVVTLDPGLAFGTGKHETTRACLEYIDEAAGEVPRSFLDMGAGSGILSIAAAKLGYKPVAGFDIDEEAVEAARENAALNQVAVDYQVFALGGGRVTLEESVEAAKGLYPDLALQHTPTPPLKKPFEPADFVVANILGPLLIAFADEIVGYLKETLVISGILNELYPEVLQTFAARGFTEVSRKTYGEWTTGLLQKEAK